MNKGLAPLVPMWHIMGKKISPQRLEKVGWA
jgi:hypothetical protein